MISILKREHRKSEPPIFGSEQKRPGANRPPEFVPESPLQKGSLGVIFSPRNYRENAHSKSANLREDTLGATCSAGPFCLLPKSGVGRRGQQDVNGEKLTMKKWWIFGADLFHGLRGDFHGL